MDRKRRAVLCGGLVLALAWLRTDAGAQPLRELTEAEAIAAATAPIDLSHLQDRTILGTLKGHALIEEYLCNGSCDKGAYRVVQLDLGGGKYLDYCEEWGGKWFELPTGPGRQKPFCIPPAVRYAQELVEAKPLSARDLADYGAQIGRIETSSDTLGKWGDFMVRVERGSTSDTGGLHIITVWLDLPEGVSCADAGGVGRTFNVGGFAPTSQWFCVPKPYDDAVQAAEARREAKLPKWP